MIKCVCCGKEVERPTNLLCKDCSDKTVEEVTTNIKHSDFIKADEGKLEWSLLPFKEIEDVVRILQFGAKKYSPGNWQKCDNWKRYEDAAMRHLVSYMKGEHTDPESGKSHMAHLICNALFLMWHDNEKPRQNYEDISLAEEYRRLNSNGVK